MGNTSFSIHLHIIRPTTRIFRLNMSRVRVINLISIITPRNFNRHHLISRVIQTTRRVVRCVMLLTRRFSLPTHSFRPTTIKGRPRISNVRALLATTLIATRSTPSPNTRLHRVRKFKRMIINPRFRSLSLIIRQITNQGSSSSHLPTLPLRFFRRLRTTPIKRRSIRRGAIMVMSNSLIRHQYVVNDLLSRVLFPTRNLRRSLPRKKFIFSGRGLRGHAFSEYGAGTQVQGRARATRIPQGPGVQGFPIPQGTEHPKVYEGRARAVTNFHLSTICFFNKLPPTPRGCFSRRSV